MNFDALYSSGFKVFLELENQGIPFIGDIRNNHKVYFDSDLENGISVSEYAKNLKKSEFEKITIRKGTKTRVKAYFHQIEVKYHLKTKQF